MVKKKKKMHNIVLFDMDGTLTPPRKPIEDDVIQALKELLSVTKVGLVTGSGYEYVKQQCASFLSSDISLENFYILPCNGTQKYSLRDGKWVQDFSLNMRQSIGDRDYNYLVRELLYHQYLCSLTSNGYGFNLAGNFIAYRDSMLNWSPTGRSANHNDRELFVEADKQFGIRKKVYKKLTSNERLSQKLSFSMGGSTSIDIYPHGWDKTYALNHFEDHNYWFVGDRCTMDAGNDKPIYDKVNELFPGQAFEVEETAQTIEIIKNIIKNL